MKRRTFLGAAVAAAAWPMLIRRAFGDISVGVGGTAGAGAGATVAARMAQARALGKPLLAIVVPDDDAKKYQRGEEAGLFLNNADKSTLATLALAEVVCATLAELGVAAQSLRGDPTYVLIEPDGRVQALEVPREANPGWSERLQARERWVDRRIAAHARALGDALAGDGDRLAARVAAARARLPPAEVAALEAAIADGSVTPAAADRGAALVLAAARQTGKAGRTALVAALAEATAARVREVPPAGSRWANQTPCGAEEVEGAHEKVAVVMGCGMGEMPERARRFLYLFTKLPQERMREEAAALRAAQKRKQP